MLQHCSSRPLTSSHGVFKSGPAPRLSRCTRARGIILASAEQRPTDAAEEQLISRRQALASKLVLVAGALAPAGSALAADVETKVAPGQMKELTDRILAYRFEYPMSTTAGKPLGMIVSRTPEKYSSAAPLTADARQRIVGEVFDFRNFVGASINVGPASGILKGRDPSGWKAREVALTVLIDRSTARTTAGQRVSLSDVQETHLETRDGQPYWVYEHISQGSPTIQVRTKESYRHSLAVTSWRAATDGTPYLYTLNLSCPEELWPELEPLFKQSVASFTLLPTTRDYIPPDKNPWLFF